MNLTKYKIDLLFTDAILRNDKEQVIQLTELYNKILEGQKEIISKEPDLLNGERTIKKEKPNWYLHMVKTNIEREYANIGTSLVRIVYHNNEKLNLQIMLPLSSLINEYNKKDGRTLSQIIDDVAIVIKHKWEIQKIATGHIDMNPYDETFKMWQAEMEKEQEISENKNLLKDDMELKNICIEKTNSISEAKDMYEWIKETK